MLQRNRGRCTRNEAKREIGHNWPFFVIIFLFLVIISLRQFRLTTAVSTVLR